MLNNDFWRSPEVIRMTPQEKYFYLYLFTNPYINHIGIYQISKKQIAFDLDHSLETVHLIMERFIEHYKLIRKRQIIPTWFVAFLYVIIS